MTHTPGPWRPTRSNPAEGYNCWWITGNEKDLATVAGGATTSEANAHLIAAAPELLEALTALVSALGQCEELSGGTEKALPIARAVIAKARGQSC